MKASVIIIFVFLCFLVTTAFSADKKGQEIFKSNGCTTCHKQHGTSGTFPSLSKLANTYKGKKEELIRYLKGEAPSIVTPKRSAIMKRQIEKTKAMTDLERAALAEFILSH
jgi:cytochrome c551/c552